MTPCLCASTGQEVALKRVPTACRAYIDNSHGAYNVSMTVLYHILFKMVQPFSSVHYWSISEHSPKSNMLLQAVLELMLSTYGFPLLLVVMLERMMSLSPQHLLSRLREKAIVMGDPNPRLVQVDIVIWAAPFSRTISCTMACLTCMQIMMSSMYFACAAVHQDQAGRG